MTWHPMNTRCNAQDGTTMNSYMIYDERVNESQVYGQDIEAETEREALRIAKEEYGMLEPKLS